MLTHKLRVAVLLLAILCTSGLVSPANASPDVSTPSSPPATTSSLPYGSQLTIDGKVMLVDVSGRFRVAPDQTQKIPSDRGQALEWIRANSSTPTLPCRTSRVFADSKGNLTLQNNNPTYSSVAWSFRNSPVLQSTITSLVSEEGLYWEVPISPSQYRSGQNAPHLVPAEYRFHGTMNPVYKYETLKYIDYFHFTVAGGGQGELSFYGTVKLTCTS